MLVIRDAQMKTFSESSVRVFVDSTVQRLFSVFPEKCQDLGRDGVISLVKEGVKKARGYEIFGESAVELFIDLMVLINPTFDTLEENEWMLGILEDHELDDDAKIKLVYTDLQQEEIAAIAD